MTGVESRITKILVVDDDHDLADILADLVSGQDRIVQACYDGLSALKTLQKEVFDLIMVDLMIPKVGGLDILKYAKQMKPDVLVMIITGYASLETAVTAIKEGAYDYIQKPCKLEEIKIAVQNAVEKIRLIKENRELLMELTEARLELESLKRDPHRGGRRTSINLFPSSMPSLHYLLDDSWGQTRPIEQLQSLILLKEKGHLDEVEFKALKEHLLKSTRLMDDTGTGWK